MASDLDAGIPSPPSPHAGSDRSPPHNLDAEASVLGSMVLSRDAIAEVAEIVGPDDFYRGSHRTLFEAARDLHDRGEPVDEVTLTDELERRGQLEDVGGPLAIADVAARVPTPANAVYYAKIVAEHAVRRRLIDAGTHIARLGWDHEKGVEEALDQAEQTVFAVSQRQRKGDFTSMKELVLRSWEIIEQLNERSSSITGLETGFTDFDELTAGLQPQNLVILAARPAMGKSTLATNILAHVATEMRKPAVIYSLEMSQLELVQRLLSAEARIDSDRMRTGQLRDQDWPKLSRAMGRLAEAPIFIDDTPNITLMEIRSKCRRLKQKHGLSLVVVDYLQLMESHRRIDSRVQEVAEFSRGLKMLAKELDLPVIALSQLSRKPEDRADRRPMLADLRESGSIEQDADLVCFIYRDEVYHEDSDAKGEAELIVAKHRNGPLRNIRLSFMGHHSRFGNLARGPMRGGPPPTAVTGMGGAPPSVGGHAGPPPAGSGQSRRHVGPPPDDVL